MMAEVPKADVVITNPTHYAVALKYERGKMYAPKVVAKGVDRVALRIKEIAVENGVPIESISSMLGHKNIRTTQIYSKVVNEKVSKDMSKLKRKLR